MESETVYIVSGFMRTGTSMMMRALEAGGMETVSRESRDEFRKQYKDEHYDPNEGGLYELETRDVKALGFPEQFKGKVIKCLMAGGGDIAVMPKIRVIFMRRDAEEIRQSYMAFFNQNIPISEADLNKRMELNIAKLKNRRDTEVTVVWYRDVIADPLSVFQMLAHEEWPIDPAKAASIVNPELLRFKREELAVGII